MGTGGRKTAFGTQPGGDDPLIDFDYHQEGDTQDASQHLYDFLTH